MANVITRLNPALNFTVLASAARTASPDTQEFEVPFRHQALHLVIDVTAVAATPALTVTVAAVDRLSGQVVTILASAAISTVSTTVLKIGQGLTAAANLVANDLVPNVFRVTATHGDADSITYSIAGQLI